MDVADFVRVVVVVVGFRNRETVFDPSPRDFPKALNVMLAEGPAINAVVGSEVVRDDVKAPVVLSEGCAVEHPTQTVFRDEVTEVGN